MVLIHFYILRRFFYVLYKVTSHIPNYIRLKVLQTAKGRNIFPSGLFKSPSNPSFFASHQDVRILKSEKFDQQIVPLTSGEMMGSDLATLVRSKVTLHIRTYAHAQHAVIHGGS